MSLRFSHGVVLLCAVLITAELLFLPLPGIGGDESGFVLPFLRNQPNEYSWHIFGRSIAVMYVSYAGELKAWLYWPIFQLWPPGVWSIRFPVCLLSLVTLALFAGVVRRISGPWVALAAGAFLATDALFVLMNVFDFGLECLLLLATVAFVSFLQRFLASGNRKYLGAAFLVAGLCLWHKAVFLFPFAAILLAFAVVYPRELRRQLLSLNLILAALCLAVGATPLVTYNLARGGGTFKAARDLPPAPTAEKMLMLRRVLEGRALEHYMFRSSIDEKVPLQGAPTAELVLRWYQHTHLHPGSALMYAMALAFLALPFLKDSPLFRPLVFTWAAVALTLGSMLVFRDAGAGPHHTILIYPGPQFIMAATGAALVQRLRGMARPVLGVLALLVVGCNVWLLGEYYHAARVNGFSVFWTDAASRLGDVVRSHALPVVSMDWSISNNVQIDTNDQFIVSGDPTPRENVLYVAHCDSYVIDDSAWKRYRELLPGSGLHVKDYQVVPDKQGRPIYCLFQLTSKDNGLSLH